MSTKGGAGMSEAEIKRTRDRLARFARLMDTAFTIPLTGIRVGLEPILGVVPVFGDVLGKGLSAYIVYKAWQLGVPPARLARMLGNIAIDLAIGTVPIVGDIGDIFWRASKYNVRILDEHLERMLALEGRKPADAVSRKRPVTIEGEAERLD